MDGPVGGVSGGVVACGPVGALIAAFRPFYLALDVGPDERFGVLFGARRDMRPCHEGERNGPEHGDGAQFGQESGQLLVEDRRHAQHADVVVIGGVERPVGEDPHHREETRDDGLHDQVAAPAESREPWCPRQLGEDGGPEDEAREKHDDLDHHPRHI